MDITPPGQINPRADDKEQPQRPPLGESRTSSASSSSLRRLACDGCRARKVRCDRRDPPCSRCAKVGTRCRYSSRMRPGSSKLDLSQFLVGLDSRLKQAEAQLATNTVGGPSAPQPQSSAMMWDTPDLPLSMTGAPSPPSSSLGTSTSPVGSAAQLAGQFPLPDGRASSHKSLPLGTANSSKETAQTTVTQWPDWTRDDIFASELLYDTFASMLPTETPGIPGFDQQHFDLDLAADFFGISNGSSSAVTPPVAVTPPELPVGFHERYFEIFHNIIPMINRTRFLAELAQTPATLEVRLLAYSMAALSALSLGPDQQAHVERLYEQARYYLDMCERDESGDSLRNINVVQACALLTLYEFQRPNFARAWITLARANRLAKIMGMDKEDQGLSSANPLANLGLSKLPRRPSTPGGLEERRRTFWVLYIFDAFASLTTKSSDFHGQIPIPLPGPTLFPEDADGTTQPSLQEVFDLPVITQLSSFAGTVLMTKLYQDCFQHTEASASQKSYDFWEAHYRLDKATTKCRNAFLAQDGSGQPQPADGALALGLQMNLGAVSIMLHEHMLAKVQQDELPASLTAEASAKCMAAVTDIVEAVRVALCLTDKKLEMFRQVDRFLLWPVTAAIQVCFRMLYHSPDNATPYIVSLRILMTLIREHIDPGHIDQVLLASVDGRVAELERSARKM